MWWPGSRRCEGLYGDDVRSSSRWFESSRRFTDQGGNRGVVVRSVDDVEAVVRLLENRGSGERCFVLAEWMRRGEIGRLRARLSASDVELRLLGRRDPIATDGRSLPWRARFLMFAAWMLAVPHRVVMRSRGRVMRMWEAVPAP